MASVKELTGGTGDTNPQLLTTTITQPAADTAITTEIPIPIARFQQKKGKAIVFEVLGIAYYLTDFAAIAAQANVRCSLATADVTGVDAPQVFDQFRVDGIFATAVGFQYYPLTQYVDLSDGAGHGFLVATDNIFATLQSTATGLANVITVKVKYRFKEVGLTEYLGIVAGQQ